jgi:hypothetical protein
LINMQWHLAEDWLLLWFFTIKADGRRIATDSQLGNVMATLKGTDPDDRDY